MLVPLCMSALLERSALFYATWVIVAPDWTFAAAYWIENPELLTSRIETGESPTVISDVPLISPAFAPV